MISTRDLVLMGGLLGLCCMAVGFLTRGGSQTVLEGAAVPGERERPERVVPPWQAAEDSWRAHLDIVEKELEQGRVDAAVRVWHDAYGAAAQSRSWQSMIAVGDAFMAIGRASGSVRGARLNAREAYLTALIRARRDRSVDGALRSVQAFRELDEPSIAEQCLRIAAQLAAGDEQAQHKVWRVRQDWSAPLTTTDF